MSEEGSCSVFSFLPKYTLISFTLWHCLPYLGAQEEARSLWLKTSTLQLGKAPASNP